MRPVWREKQKCLFVGGAVVLGAKGSIRLDRGALRVRVLDQLLVSCPGKQKHSEKSVTWLCLTYHRYHKMNAINKSQ
jgi:hypothetical protein